MELQTTTKLGRQKDGVDFEICLRMNKSGLGLPDVDMDKTCATELFIQISFGILYDGESIG